MVGSLVSGDLALACDSGSMFAEVMELIALLAIPGVSWISAVSARSAVLAGRLVSAGLSMMLVGEHVRAESGSRPRRMQVIVPCASTRRNGRESRSAECFVYEQRKRMPVRRRTLTRMMSRLVSQLVSCVTTVLMSTTIVYLGVEDVSVAQGVVFCGQLLASLKCGVLGVVEAGAHAEGDVRGVWRLT